MDKIDSISFLSKNTVLNLQDSKKENSEKTSAVNDLQNNTLAEAIGRSQVNFKGVEKLAKLTVQDAKFVEIVGKIFKLDKDEVKFVEDFTKEFLQKEKMKSLNSMKSEDIFEYANEWGYYTEQIAKKLDLSDYESIDLDWLLTVHVKDNITNFRNPFGESILDAYRYATDYTPIQAIMSKYGLSDNFINSVYDYLGSISKLMDCDSIFDLFNKTNVEYGAQTLQKILNKQFKKEPDKIADILIDFHSMSGKNRKERLKGINIHSIQELFDDSINTIVIANKIDNKFNIGISKELLEMLSLRKTNTQIHKEGQSLEEVAYKIAEKYDLPPGAEKDIIKIINETKPESLDVVSNIAEAFKKDELIK